ncbi:MAG: hypothetical protein HYS15_01555 [Candidatus Spechtbacteria bacterium]|nr:hypothetical protein [Candidatus Spechtbacteria bacterium]
MMGNSKGMYGIEWSLNSQGGYRAILNGIGLYLLEDQGRDPRVYLFLLKDRAKARIVEPAMHLSCAPIGKFLRQVTFSVGMDPWPKLPETPREKANEMLRVALNKLHERVFEQDELRPPNALLGEDLRAAIASRMFRQNFFDPTEDQDNEQVRQKLFHELLRLKPAT